MTTEQTGGGGMRHEIEGVRLDGARWLRCTKCGRLWPVPVAVDPATLACQPEPTP